MKRACFLMCLIVCTASAQTTKHRATNPFLQNDDPLGKPCRNTSNPVNDTGSYNGTYIKCDKGITVLDTAMHDLAANEEQHRQDLYFALLTRVLTDSEMAEVKRRGRDLLIPANTESFVTVQQQEELFNQALYLQARIRIDAETAKRCAKP